MRHSEQRDTVLKVIKASKDHPSADTVYKRVREEIPNISLGTVYRNLKDLSDIGMLETLKTSDKSIRYDGDTKEHCHFICTQCSKIIDLPYPEINVPSAADEMGLLIESQNVIYYGLCADCRKEN